VATPPPGRSSARCSRAGTGTTTSSTKISSPTPRKPQARALSEATKVLARTSGTLALDSWNDAPERTRSDVIAAVDRALSLLHPDQAEAV
jgi:hypothetical protein